MQLVQHILGACTERMMTGGEVNCGRCVGCMEREGWTPPPTHGVAISQPQMAIESRIENVD
jgi:hypothetical protein